MTGVGAAGGGHLHVVGAGREGQVVTDGRERHVAQDRLAVDPDVDVGSVRGGVYDTNEGFVLCGDRHRQGGDEAEAPEYAEGTLHGAGHRSVLLCPALPAASASGPICTMSVYRHSPALLSRVSRERYHARSMYTIKEASARSGVGIPLLRAWERRYRGRHTDAHSVGIPPVRRHRHRAAAGNARASLPPAGRHSRPPTECAPRVRTDLASLLPTRGAGGESSASLRIPSEERHIEGRASDVLIARLRRGGPAD